MIFKRWRRTATATATAHMPAALTPNATAAADAFQSLRALDANAPFKAELMAAQIAPSRIAALYPDSEFAEIAGGLSAKLPELSPAALSNSISRCNELADAVMSIMGSGLYTVGYANLKPGDRPDEAGRTQLQLDIADHLAAHRAAPEHPLLAAYQAANLVNACWLAWQTMTHRKALSTRLQGRVDELMLWVAATFELS